MRRQVAFSNTSRVCLIITLFVKTRVDSADCTARKMPGLSDDKITASSEKSSSYLSSYARLDSNLGRNWCPSSTASSEYIQVDLTSVTTVTAIITQGRHNMDCWVKKYNVRYSRDGNSWTYIKENSGAIKEFSGNSDKNTWVTRTLSTPIDAQYLRIYPIAYNFYPCLRFDVLGCEATEITTTTTITTTTSEPTSTQATSTLSDDQTTTTTATSSSSSTTTTSSTTSSTSTTSTSSEPTSTQATSTISDDQTTTTTTTSSSSEATSTSAMSTDGTTSVTQPIVSSDCHMVCPKNYTIQELVETVEKMKEELKTEKTKTSKYIRSKTSAPDERKSSAAIGMVGIAILSAIGIGMVVLDLPNLVRLIQQITHRIAQCKDNNY